MDTLKTVKRTSPNYTTALNNFKGQFKDVVIMNKLYINSDNKVYAGEWIDSKGVINFNGGFAPDIHRTIIFED